MAVVLMFCYDRYRPRSEFVHSAIRLALQEQLRRKARLRRKRNRSAPPQTAPAEPPLSVASKYRASLRLLGKDADQFLRTWKARRHCTYEEVVALLPPDRPLSGSELHDLTAMLLSLAIELRKVPAPVEHDPPLLDRKRILLVHPDRGILFRIARALEDEGAEVLAPGTHIDSILACAADPALDGAVLNFMSDRVPILRIANRLDVREIPIVFYTAFETKLVARATAHINCVIIPNPSSTKAIVSALAALIRDRRHRRLRSLLDN